MNEQNLQMLSLDLDEEGPQAYEKYWKVENISQHDKWKGKQ